MTIILNVMSQPMGTQGLVSLPPKNDKIWMGETFQRRCQGPLYWQNTKMRWDMSITTTNTAKVCYTLQKLGKQKIGKQGFNLNYLGLPLWMLSSLVASLCQNGSTNKLTNNHFSGNSFTLSFLKLIPDPCQPVPVKERKLLTLHYIANKLLLDSIRSRLAITKAL